MSPLHSAVALAGTGFPFPCRRLVHIASSSRVLGMEDPPEHNVSQRIRPLESRLGAGVVLAQIGRNGCVLCASDRLGGGARWYFDRLRLTSMAGSQLQRNDGPGRGERRLRNVHPQAVGLVRSFRRWRRRVRSMRRCERRGGGRAGAPLWRPSRFRPRRQETRRRRAMGDNRGSAGDTGRRRRTMNAFNRSVRPSTPGMSPRRRRATRRRW
jgi:hypothetical protein